MVCALNRYLWCHEGGCEHSLRFVDLRMPSAADPPTCENTPHRGAAGGGAEPLQTYLSLPGRPRCGACLLLAADVVTYFDPLLAATPKDGHREDAPAAAAAPSRGRGSSSTASTGPSASPAAAAAPGPSLFCRACHLALHYSAGGELLEPCKSDPSFRVFPWLPLAL